MKHQSISPSWKPIDERKRLSFGQLRFARIIAVIVFTLLIIVSYSSYGRHHAGIAKPKGMEERVIYCTGIPVAKHNGESGMKMNQKHMSYERN